MWSLDNLMHRLHFSNSFNSFPWLLLLSAVPRTPKYGVLHPHIRRIIAESRSAAEASNSRLMIAAQSDAMWSVQSSMLSSFVKASLTPLQQLLVFHQCSRRSSVLGSGLVDLLVGCVEFSISMPPQLASIGQLCHRLLLFADGQFYHIV